MPTIAQIAAQVRPLIEEVDADRAEEERLSGVRVVDVPNVIRLRLLWHTGAIWEIEAERAPRRRVGHVNWRLLSTSTQDDLPKAVS